MFAERRPVGRLAGCGLDETAVHCFWLLCAACRLLPLACRSSPGEGCLHGTCRPPPGRLDAPPPAAVPMQHCSCWSPGLSYARSQVRCSSLLRTCRYVPRPPTQCVCVAGVAPAHPLPIDRASGSARHRAAAPLEQSRTRCMACTTCHACLPLSAEVACLHGYRGQRLRQR